MYSKRMKQYRRCGHHYQVDTNRCNNITAEIPMSTMFHSVGIFAIFRKILMWNIEGTSPDVFPSCPRSRTTIFLVIESQPCFILLQTPQQSSSLVWSGSSTIELCALSVPYQCSVPYGLMVQPYATTNPFAELLFPFSSLWRYCLQEDGAHAGTPRLKKISETLGIPSLLITTTLMSIGVTADADMRV